MDCPRCAADRPGQEQDFSGSMGTDPGFSAELMGNTPGNKIRRLLTTAGRGILGVVDGESPFGVETESDVTARKQLLREMGYKL
jgi:hypothetical protein